MDLFFTATENAIYFISS